MKRIKIYTSMLAIASTGLACGATTEQPSQSSHRFSPAHLETVLRGAIVISNPGTPLLVSDSRLQQVPGGYEFRVAGEEWSGYYQSSTPIMDIDYPITVTLDSTGNIKDISKLPFNRLDSALRYFSRGSGDGSDWILPRLPTGIRARALVEFKNPIAEKNLVWDYQSNRFFLSRGSGNDRPIYWGGDIGCPPPPVKPACHGNSAVETFRSWVQRLTDKDRPILDKFGISLNSLRAVAQESQIYGLIQEASPQVVRRFRKDKNVRSLWVIDMWPCRQKEPCP
ncbi:hypothetical protein IMZ11_26790 [Microtetraspora sp. AC03309]|uniref:hypothetical protein n=1 Tax=Microtetraspora sp. AC03309 TaxID=2779376 RepID=UPI001E5B531B|nr:hypothetical protein [Microtetraspora sp. AC03309]MCC5579240.1 hypothetical protein [Microtetraspora sp. AC03309]